MTVIKYLAVGGIFIDDIVYPDGRTDMGILGGGGVHCALGMVLWDQLPGLVAVAGNNLPNDIQERLERDLDLQGVIHQNIAHARAWQIFEWDHRRTELYRVEHIDLFNDRPFVTDMPMIYYQAQGIALLRDAHYLSAWRDQYPSATILWEPPMAFMIRDNLDAFRAGLPYADIVSPNLLEASQVYELDDPNALVQHMLNDGAKIVALRMGEKGSIVASQTTANTIFHIPSVPVPEIVDQTGAGNTYCGGFLVGWIETGDLVAAGCYGAVAASFTLEVIGAAAIPDDLAVTRSQRYESARHAVSDEVW